MKTVHLFDKDSGAYLGPYDAQESPLEPGIFIVPNESTGKAPPSFDTSTHTARWVDGSWVTEALPAEPAPASPTEAEILEAFTSAIQSHLDDFARTRNYDGILSACTYATSGIANFAAEAAYCVEARDAAWATGYQILADVQQGKRPMPTIDAVIAELPLLNWPV